MKDLNGLNSKRASRSELDSNDRGRRLRILAVGDIIPWPARDGYRLRFASVISALSEIGDVDLFVGSHGDDEGEPSSVLHRYEAVVVPWTPYSVKLVIRTCVSRLPSRIVWREWEEARSSIRRFVREPYDLVWYSHADSFVGMGDPSFGPAVVDLDNLERNVLRLRSSSFPKSSTGGEGVLRFLRIRVIDSLRRTLNWRDRVLWSRLQRGIARVAKSTLVCSEDDQKRLLPVRLAVVPNSYADPGPPSDYIITAPILVMVGLFTYQPNLDGARWFAYDVFPTLRELVPGVRVRLVGRYDERLLNTISVPGIEIVGQIDEIGQELRNARGAFIPILSGSGTRIKVLEALAYGLPVVTTKVGCEGLGIVSDVHALVRDDPVAFAAACAQVLTDDEVLRKLRLNGRRLFLDHYDSGSVKVRIRQLAMDVVIANSTQSYEEQRRNQ